MVYKYRKSINFGRLLPLLFVFVLTVFMLAGCLSTSESSSISAENISQPAQAKLIEDKVSQTEASSDNKDKPESELLLDEDGIYTTKEDVSLYIHLYG